VLRPKLAAPHFFTIFDAIDLKFLIGTDCYMFAVAQTACHSKHKHAQRKATVHGLFPGKPLIEWHYDVHHILLNILPSQGISIASNKAQRKVKHHA
jgi:hypothetical protein